MARTLWAQFDASILILASGNNEPICLITCLTRTNHSALPEAGKQCYNAKEKSNEEFLCLKDATQPFVWQSDDTVINLDFISWSGGVGDGNCLTAFYTAEYVGLQWITVAAVEEAACDAGHAVICEHKGNCSSFPSSTYCCAFVPFFGAFSFGCQWRGVTNFLPKLFTYMHRAFAGP